MKIKEIRAVDLDAKRLPYDVLEKIASSIVRDIPEVVSVTYHIATKPPSTIEVV